MQPLHLPSSSTSQTSWILPWLGCGVGLHLKTSDQGGSLNHHPLTVPLIPWQPVIPKLALAARTPAHVASLPALSLSSISGSQQFWGATVLSPTSPLTLGLIYGGSGRPMLVYALVWFLSCPADVLSTKHYRAVPHALSLSHNQEDQTLRRQHVFWSHGSSERD